MRDLSVLLEEAAAVHGHVCPGQVLGVRMAAAGCQALGIDEPKGGKRLLVYVEIDRCAADAIGAVTGCRLGKRTLKYVDYGKQAATFADLQTGRAVRVAALETAREHVGSYAQDTGDRYAAQIEAYRVMPDEELLTVQSVRLHVLEEDMPGRPVSRVICAICGEGVNDRREVWRDGQSVCRACAEKAYYEPL